jgi:hypothetical protein
MFKVYKFQVLPIHPPLGDFHDYLYVLSWDQFKGAVMNEFEANSHSDRMLDLLTLRHSGLL